MNRILPLVVTAALALSSVWAGVDSYLRTEKGIAADLTHALALTALERPADWLEADTVRSFRSHLQLAALRDKSFLMLSLPGGGQPGRLRGAVCSDTLAVAAGVQAQGYATCSVLAVWRMSDQRLAALLVVLTLLMGWLCRLTPDLSLSKRGGAAGWHPLAGPEDSLFEREEGGGESLPLTPMQEQLLQLLLASPTRELTKQEICEALWPKKEDASETLYTLVHRTKPLLEAHSQWRIVSRPGRSYRLETRGNKEVES